MKPIYTVATTLLAVSLLSGAGGSASAQTSPAPAVAPPGVGGPQYGAPPGVLSAEEPRGHQESEVERQAPVLMVTSIEVMRSTHGPELDIVRVRGLTSTDGWTDAELVPLTHGVPPDGILDLIFVAKPPPEAAESTGFEAIEAILPIEADHPYKGIRVHGATNPVTLAAIPGYAESGPPVEDCNKCVGKYFVPKGAAAPANKTAAEVVKEENLPAALRVIRTSDGIAKLDSDPNRLTLVVGDDGRIVTAIWD